MLFLVVFISIGVVLIILVIVVFICYNEIFVIMVFGRELCYVFLIGILMVYGIFVMMFVCLIVILCMFR